jgi:hypothetical protein
MQFRLVQEEMRTTQTMRWQPYIKETLGEPMILWGDLVG